jgi:hypothetical protein
VGIIRSAHAEANKKPIHQKLLPSVARKAIPKQEHQSETIFFRLV